MLVLTTTAHGQQLRTGRLVLAAEEGRLVLFKFNDCEIELSPAELAQLRQLVSDPRADTLARSIAPAAVAAD